MRRMKAREGKRRERIEPRTSPKRLARRNQDEASESHEEDDEIPNSEDLRRDDRKAARKEPRRTEGRGADIEHQSLPPPCEGIRVSPKASRPRRYSIREISRPVSSRVFRSCSIGPVKLGGWRLEIVEEHIPVLSTPPFSYVSRFRTYSLSAQVYELHNLWAAWRDLYDRTQGSAVRSSSFRDLCGLRRFECSIVVSTSNDVGKKTWLDLHRN